ncbi:MAG: response regulator transcription factor [Caldilineaceae bacterium]|nr:response regulator transcription factor [Caldilineaceae bacterium]
MGDSLETSNFKRRRQPTILVVEDEDFLRSLLQVSLEKEGYAVVTAMDGLQAMRVFTDRPIDLILLDVLMPNMSGFEVCAEIRKRSDVPIVMLTALNSPDDTVQGFELGADDFISKPFTFKEVHARLQAILRRISWAREQPAFMIMTHGRITINDEAHTVTAHNEAVHLTPIEYQLLHFLMSHPNRPISKEVLFKEVWGYDFTGGTNLVEVAMRRLREKIELNPSTPQYLVTVRGTGYKFVAPEVSPSAINHRSELVQ